MKVRTISNYLTTISLAVALAFFIKWSMVAIYKITTKSMNPTLVVGDYVIVNKAAYGFKWTPVSDSLFIKDPQRGDLVVFTLTEGSGTQYIKRVIGLPGEKIEIKKGILNINDNPVTYQIKPDVNEALFKEFGESVENKNWTILRSSDYNTKNFGPVIVKEGQYFVLGDNRDSTEDSRVWGAIDRKLIKGRVQRVAISWSLEMGFDRSRMMLSVIP